MRATKTRLSLYAFCLQHNVCLLLFILSCLWAESSTFENIDSKGTPVSTCLGDMPSNTVAGLSLAKGVN